MNTHAKKISLTLLAAGLMFVSFPAFALEINNNTGLTLMVSVKCGTTADTFQVGPNQVGACPSNVCRLYTPCSYQVSASGADGCSGSIDGGSGMQIDNPDSSTLICQPYGG